MDEGVKIFDEGVKEAMRVASERMENNQNYCQSAVAANGLFLECVPPPMKSRMVCETAVKSDGTSLRFVPEKLKSPEICLEALEE